MEQTEIDKLKELMYNHGDGYWSEEDGANLYIIGEILEVINSVGYDLKLVPMHKLDKLLQGREVMR